MKSKLAYFAILIALSLHAQTPVQQTPVRAHTPKFCGQAEMNDAAIAAHPEIVQATEQMEAYSQDYVAKNKGVKTASSGKVFLIPVVFHIIHNYGPENIPDAEIYNEMIQLNNDYRMLNSDSTLVISQFDTIKADAHFEFRLAQKDPNGNCTNGIDRIASVLTYDAGDSSKLNQWDPSKYLNVWVVNSLYNDFAGYTYIPSTAANPAIKPYDGVIMLYDYVGGIDQSIPQVSRCLTHEIGHYFNLYHPWGPSNAPGVKCGNDGVNDTPVTKGYDYCPTSPSDAEICTAGVVENYQNFMEYSYCSNMFTADQASRMHAAAYSSVANRNNLWQPANLTATGINIDTTVNNLCTAAFTMDKNTICEGASINFTDASWNGTPTSWNWSFPGGKPATATTSSVNVVYPDPGTYGATLTVSNGVSSPSVTENNIVFVLSSTAAQSAPFFDGFETGGPFPNANWAFDEITQESDYSWATTSPGYNSNTSAFINNFDCDTAATGQLFSTTINLSTVPSPKLYFRVAYAQKEASNTDSLNVFVSSNCGAGWGSPRFKASGKNLATVAPTTAPFKPSSASQWKLDSVSLTPFASMKNVRIIFQFSNGLGNNIYLDNINIASSDISAGIEEDLMKNTIDMNLYPNPVGDNATLSFYLANSASVSIRIYDILGKEIMSLANGEKLGNGTHQYAVSSSGISSGIYFVRLLADDQQFVQKFVVR